jgi:hypothetical protein
MLKKLEISPPFLFPCPWFQLAYRSGDSFSLISRQEIIVLDPPRAGSNVFFFFLENQAERVAVRKMEWHSHQPEGHTASWTGSGVLGDEDNLSSPQARLP